MRKQAQKKNYYEHILGMDKNRFPKILLNYKPEVTRGTLRPIIMHLNNIYKFSSYLTGNTRLHYKAQPVNAGLGKQSLFTVRTIRNTQIHSVGRM
jgi:hypothetical protein